MPWWDTAALSCRYGAKVLGAAFWRDRRLDYFALTADGVLGVAPAAPESEHAWG